MRLTVGGFAAILRNSHLPALDGVRAVSVMLVMLGHAGLSNGAGTGVNTFFVLSGFLITHLLLKEYEKNSDISISSFYLRRALRIFPAYYVFLAFSFTVDSYQGDARSREVIWPAATYLLNYYHAVHGHSDASIAHAWSLAVEEQFYLIWPLLLILVLRLGRNVLFGITVTLIVAVCAWRSFGYWTHVLSRSWVYNALDCRFDSLAVGCLCAISIRRQSWIAGCEKIASSPLWPLLIVALLALPHLFPSATWKYTLGPTVEAILAGVLLLQLMQLAQRRLWCWLEWPPVAYLGRISYSAYLYHQWGLGLGDNFSGLPPALQFATGVIATIFLASCSYYVIERPFLKWKVHLNAKRSPGQRQPAQG